METAVLAFNAKLKIIYKKSTYVYPNHLKIQNSAGSGLGI